MPGGISQPDPAPPAMATTMMTHYRPKVGCMGQVRRNNRVVGFPTLIGRIPVVARACGGKYSNLKRIFSAAAVTKPAIPTVNSCRVHGRSTVATSYRKISCEKEKVGTVSIVDMALPLPVTRKAPNDRNSTDVDGDRDRGDLWKRRLGGMGLKKLEASEDSNSIKAILT